MKLAAFPPDAAFLPALASAWLSSGAEAGQGLIILPNRRAARALAGAFLRANAGRALLLPRIIAQGAIDEAGLAIGQALDLPPAIAPVQRQAMLAALILKRGGANGAPASLPGAWALAADLALLLDEADAAEINLADRLPSLVSGELAAHWQTTLEFLTIVTHAWPAILAEQRVMNPLARQTALITAQIAAWQAAPPAHRVWLVARAATPAGARLAAAVADLPHGRLLLPGYVDDHLLPDAAWEALDDSHPQAGIARLLGAIGARREDIEAWPAATAVPTHRAALLSRALLPAACLGDWQSAPTLPSENLFRLAAPDEQADATAIAMVLRDAIETPGTSAALVTPDRALAARVTAQLRRFGITADDSAGEPLSDTPPSVLLRLLARAALAHYAPVELLALLKHPLTAAGLPPENCRALARRLELAALRGPRPDPGFAGITRRLDDDKHRAERDFLARLEQHLSPLIGLPETLNPAAALRLLLTAGESLATTPDQEGAAILWSGEAGASLADVLTEAMAAIEALPDIVATELPALLDAILTGHVIRRPRTRDGHPRIAIWGVQEAVLQSVDTAVLAGLNEGVWPAQADPGPWMSRPMRHAAGLASPEQLIGMAAQDFFALAASCTNVVLAAPLRRERAPAVPARWLTRLEALLIGAGTPLPQHPAVAWAAALDMPATRLARPKPRPTPPAAARPRTLSISDIATLIADPYALYARKILNIRQLDELDQESDSSLFGNIVHDGLAAFYGVTKDFFTADAVAALDNHLQVAMRAARPRAALESWWSARLSRIAAWVIAAEQRRWADSAPRHVDLEISASLDVLGGFTLKGRADRIERRADGTVFIVDYKTGAPPTTPQLRAGAAPQLPLEAVMAEAGAFGPKYKATVAELAFWQLTGRRDSGKLQPVLEKPEDLRDVITKAQKALPSLFRRYADPLTPYLARPHPDRTTYDDPYAGISRRAEWDSA
jgi:ATP-dependent helicase/nuclease subunit B